MDAGPGYRVAMKAVDVVLPVYNEEEVLDSFHASLTSALQALADPARV